MVSTARFEELSFVTCSFFAFSMYLHFMLDQITANESLIGDFSCAISKKILIHGRLFVSAHFICFYSNIFGSETKVVIRVQDVLAVRPASLISIIPNSIEVDTVTSPNEPYLFTSFLSRDEVLSILESIVTRAKSSPTPLLSPAPTSAAPSTPITAQSPNHTAASASESKSEQKASMVRRLSSLMNPLNWNQNSPSDRLKSPQTPPLTPTSFNSAFHSPSPGDQRRKSTDMSVSPSTPAEHRPRSASAALPMSASTPIRVVEPVALEYQQSLPLDPSPPIPSIAAELHDSDLEELFCTDVVGITPHAYANICSCITTIQFPNLASCFAGFINCASRKTHQHRRIFSTPQLGVQNFAFRTGCVTALDLIPLRLPCWNTALKQSSHFFDRSCSVLQWQVTVCSS
jgi:hypothetical protein